MYSNQSWHQNTDCSLHSCHCPMQEELALIHHLRLNEVSLVPSGPDYVWPRPRHVATPDLSEKMPLCSRAALALFSYGTRVSALITLSSISGASSQVIALKGIQLTDTIVLQRVLASLGIRLANLMGAKDQNCAYNSVFTGWENNQPQFWPTQKHTVCPNNHCTNVHGTLAQ